MASPAIRFPGATFKTGFLALPEYAAHILMSPLNLIRPALLFLFAVFSGIVQAAPAYSLTVPAETAYLVPDPNGARVKAGEGITKWADPKLKVIWYGMLKNKGVLKAALKIKLESGKRSRLALTIAGKTSERSITANSDSAMLVDFGEFTIHEPGYHAFQLGFMNMKGLPAGDLKALLLDGPAMANAHFNLKPRRNAASVHLRYPVKKGTEMSAFYCELTAIEDPLWTYYMACGWHRGYFGMQVNSPTERRIIFSVWDSGNEAVSREKVNNENRVQLVAKGDDIYTGSFGNEGTGGHSHLKFQWKTGEKQRFFVTAEPVDETHTVFAGYYFRPDKKEWMLISSWKAPKEGRYLRSLYSFSENFAGKNGQLLRKARYGNQWIRDAHGKWQEITTATFSHDPTGKVNRLDRFMGVEKGQFFLSHGGFVPGFTEYGTSFDRPASRQSPQAMKLPPLPAAVK